MLYFDKYTMPAASLGDNNPMPDIKNNTYIHAGFEITPAVTAEERTYLGKGMLNTILPYQMQDGYDRERHAREFRAAILENNYLKAVFLPEIGGRLWSLYDKKLDRELLYKNPVFQPCNLALRNAWFSGGVEFNVGIKGHNPLTCSPLYCAVENTADGEVLALYEYERIRGVVYCIRAWLPEDSKVLYIKVTIENNTDEQKHMYWWSNIAVPETPDTRVIVPADDSFLCFYQEDHYLLDKTAVPYSMNTDISYPANLPFSHDFFFKIPPASPKWVASAAKDGIGLIQCSNDVLMGRKMFLWGQNPGGRNWNNFLSGADEAYIEIQAGLAHTQLEHIPMPPRTEWSWVEAYTALDGDPAKLHSENWEDAIAEVSRCISGRVGDTRSIYFPESDAASMRIISCGSGWGAVEEKLRGEKLSKTCRFEETGDPECTVWNALIENGAFPEPDILHVPESYAVDTKILEKLEALDRQTWYSLFHIGVIRYANGNIPGARDAWNASAALHENPWAYRCLAMLAKNEVGDPNTAYSIIKKAIALMPHNRVLCMEYAMILTSCGKDEEWLDYYAALPEELQQKGRLRLYKAIALMNLNRLQEAAGIINEDFVLNDVKEGELSVSHLWFDLYRRLYAEQTGTDDPAAADARYPLPRKLDFRMS